MKIFTEEEATTVVRPERGAWTWPEPVLVMVSNSGPVIRPVVGNRLLHQDGDPFEFAVALNMLQTLYRAGYVVAKLPEGARESKLVERRAALEAQPVEISIDLDRDGPTGALQVSISETRANGGGPGYRIIGPKYAGVSEPIRRHVLTERDADAIRRFLDKVVDKPKTADGS